MKAVSSLILSCLAMTSLNVLADGVANSQSNAPVIYANPAPTKITPEWAKGSCAAKRIAASAQRYNVKFTTFSRDIRHAKYNYDAAVVRRILEFADVGMKPSDEHGNSIDYAKILPKHGFVDTGIRNVQKAPIGSIIVFEGSRYGDIQIRQDAQTLQAQFSSNIHGFPRRNMKVAAIFMPGPDLVKANAKRCE